MQMDAVERTEDLEASIHIAESKLEQKENLLRQKEYDQARLVEDQERLQIELNERSEEIARLTQ